MAIVLERQRRPINFFAIGIFIFLFGFLGFAAYYLFFAASPKFDAVLPAPLERANVLEGINFVDPEEIIGNPKFARLKQYEKDPGIGFIGRSNPFEQLPRSK